MPLPVKPLFRRDALRPGLAGFVVPPASSDARPALARWAGLLATDAGRAQKETELLPDFLRDVFQGVLGYAGPPATPQTFKREGLVRVAGKFADAGLGRFGPAGDRYAVVVEGKGPRDPLDTPFGGRKLAAVEQALLYAIDLQIRWYLVTNLVELRLYCRDRDTRTFERFLLSDLAADGAVLARFVFLLGAERVVPASGENHLDALLDASHRAGRELTAEFYDEYQFTRRSTLNQLRVANPAVEPNRLLAATQKMLDRVLFAAFCEDRGLLPERIIERAYQQANPFDPRPVWFNFQGLFRAIDGGNPALGVPAYNGGLFAPDPLLDAPAALHVPDGVCDGFKNLAAYEFGDVGSDAAGDTDAAARLIDVEILGHIFERSISDLEELERQLADAPDAPLPAARAPGRRKKEGAFYTPESVTRYVVAETLGPVLAARFRRLRADHEEAAAGTARAALADPRAFDADALNNPQRLALQQFWGAWLDALETVRVLDPACGSGAFLVEAFDQLYAEYAAAQEFLRRLEGAATLFDLSRTILTRNLFGVDLNGEAVAVARLACWIKTAERGKPLTALDRNVRQGNSILGEKDGPPLDSWRTWFPDALAAGGFDAVVGNPPYVRQEWISADKPRLRLHYRAFNGAADLYVYFFELGLNLLRPGGRLGYVVTNKWMRAGYAENLRRLLGGETWVESVLDLGHNKEVFPDADVFPCVAVVRRPDDGIPPAGTRVCRLPREQTRLNDLSRQASEEGLAVQRERFGTAPWSLEPPGIEVLVEKIKAAGIPLRDFVGASPLYGIKTGFNKAFLIDTPTKEKLTRQDPNSAALFRPYLRGEDVDRWQTDATGRWMIALRSSANHQWPWARLPTEAAETVFREAYPALYNHFEQHRRRLNTRQDKGRHWWELRACAYWEKFDASKIMYKDLAWTSRFCLDNSGTLCNNTVYFLPTNDLWVLACLNSPMAWWLMWRTVQHGKDETLRLFTEYLDPFPIARPTDESRTAVENDVRRLIELAGVAASGRRALLNWLRVEFGIEKPSDKLAAPTALSPAELATEVSEKRGKRKALTVAEVKKLNGAHTEAVVPLLEAAAEAAALERRVAGRVANAYGLNEDDLKLIQQTAPPRMPNGTSA